MNRFDKERIMAEGGALREISLSDCLDTVVRYGGIRVELKTDGTVDMYTNGSVKLHPANDSTPAEAAPQPGDRMEDGAVYAGISPETGKPMYTTPADAPLTMK
jgi:hypothetical protein